MDLNKKFYKIGHYKYYATVESQPGAKVINILQL
jgi:hypothetical protein